MRADWQVETAGPNDKLVISQETKIWNSASQQWEDVGSNAFATSKVTFD